MSLSLTRLNLGKARLLLVDDSEPSMEILSQALLGFGVSHSRKCASAAEARAALAETEYDLLLVDHDMPGEDGMDVCRHLRCDARARNYTTPFILLTALPSLVTVGEARDAGAHFVIAKPVSPGVLLQRIEWIARSQRDFVTSANYDGPDRRFQNLPLPVGTDERRQDALRLMEEPEKALSQDDINALFD